jgi:hypothetical protein
MIQKYAVNLATKMGIKLSQVQLFDGKLLGCRDCLTFPPETEPLQT